MKISVNLTQAMGASFDAPSPVDGQVFHSFQKCGGNQRMRRIRIRNAHDAFAVANQFANAPDVQARSGSALLMDLYEVIAERVCPGELEVGCDARIANTFEIVRISFTLHIFREQEELLHVADRNELPAAPKTPDIQRADVPGKQSERSMIPDELFCAIRHVLVTEGTGTYRVENDREAFPAFTSKIHFQRNAISAFFDAGIRMRLAEYGHFPDSYGLAEHCLKIAFDLFEIPVRHSSLHRLRFALLFAGQFNDLHELSHYAQRQQGDAPFRACRRIPEISGHKRKRLSMRDGRQSWSATCASNYFRSRREMNMIANATEFELLRAGALREVLRSSGPCITISLPPYRPGETDNSPAALLKTYVRDAGDQLREDGYAKSASLLKPLQDLAGDPVLSAGSHYGRAIFCSPAEIEQFCLTIAVAPSLRIGGSFFIRHFAPELSRPSAFYVLALSKTRVGLLRCAGFRAEPARLPAGVPETLGEALALERPDHDLENRSAAGASTGAMRMVRFGTGSEHERQKTHLADYYKTVDRGLQQVFTQPETPLILAGVQEDVALYRAVNTHRSLAKASIHGSPDLSRDRVEILRQAYSILRRERMEHQRDALLAAKEQLGPGRLSTELKTILSAAFEGRLAQLYVNEGANSIGVFERGTYQSWRKEDLLNVAAVQTVIHRGKFCELPDDMMSGDAAIGIMRF